MKILGLLLISSLVFFAPPLATHAVFIDSNIQCPPGGMVGQPCEDNTHGFVTKGKCDSIYVCVATQINPQVPQTCSSGSPDCPTGREYIPPPPQRPRSMTALTIPMGSLSSEMREIFDAVFSEVGKTGGVSIATSSESIVIQLAALEDPIPGAPLKYSTASFDPLQSALFQSLRDSAVSLKPGTANNVSGTTSRSFAEQRFASLGAFGGSGGSPQETGGGTEEQKSWIPEELLALWRMLSLLYEVLAHFFKTIGFILLADFSTAGMHWEDMHEIFSAAIEIGKYRLGI